MKKRELAAVLLLTLLLLPILTITSRSAPQEKVIATAITAANNNDSFSSIIVLINGPTSYPLETEVNQLGGKVIREFTYLRGFAAILPTSALGRLASDSRVVAITPDRPISPHMDITLPTVGGDRAQQSFGLDGQGIGVAIVDSGINEEDEDLDSNNSGQSRVVYSENFVLNEKTTMDLYGHGTHVAGIVAGDGSVSMGDSSYRTIKGIAPRANLINLRVLNSQGNGQESDVIAGIEKAISLQSKYNIKIINLSLGAGVTESYNRDPLCQVVNLAWYRGIVVVASAGNYGNTPYGPYGLITSPGNSPLVITVGATNSWGTESLGDDTITTYSSRGPTLFDHVVKPDLVAPGNKVKSILAKGSKLDLDLMFASNHVDPSYYYSNPSGKSVEYFTLSGTSMAAPVVSGAAALMLQKDPRLNNDTVKLRLMASAGKTFSQQYDIFTVGAGLLDIPAALQKTGTAINSKSPYIKRDPNDPNLYLVVDAGWSSKQEFSTGVVWGVNKVGSNGVVWGVSGVWSNGVVWGVVSPFEDPIFNSANATSQCLISAYGD